MQSEQDVSKALDALEDAINEHVDRIAGQITDLLVAMHGQSAKTAALLAEMAASSRGPDDKLH